MQMLIQLKAVCFPLFAIKNGLTISRGVLMRKLLLVSFQSLCYVEVFFILIRLLESQLLQRIWKLFGQLCIFLSKREDFQLQSFYNILFLPILLCIQADEIRKRFKCYCLQKLYLISHLLFHFDQMQPQAINMVLQVLQFFAIQRSFQKSGFAFDISQALLIDLKLVTLTKHHFLKLLLWLPCLLLLTITTQYWLN